MRARTVLTALTSFAGCAALASCIDLFHSTDFDNLCVFDAQACDSDARTADGASTGEGGSNDGSGLGEGGEDDASEAGAREAGAGPTDFCKFTYTQAHAAAYHACAWLGACQTSYGHNAFGTCLDYALRAYDCAVNPSFPVVGDAHAYWDCLRRAASCDDVAKCVYPAGPQPCHASGSPFVGCAGQVAPYEKNNATRVDCPASSGLTAPKGAESCIAVGQTCQRAGTIECGAAPDGTCVPLSCSGTLLRDCDDAGLHDRGISCALYGSGACAQVNLGGPFATCLPAASASPCTVSPNAQCSAGIVTACFTGRLEQLDCRGLLEDAGRCDLTAGGGQPVWDLSRYCVATTAGGCTESCTGGTVTACQRGRPVSVDCTSLGLKPCQGTTPVCTSP